MIIKENDKRGLKVIKSRLIKGGVFIFPTFTIYGFSACLFDVYANKKILSLKKRSVNNPFIVIADLDFIVDASDFSDKDFLVSILKANATVIVKTKIKFPFYASKDNKTAFRLANTDVLRYLTDRFPITSTSVNISGKQAINDVKKIVNIYKNRVFGIVCGRVENIQSTIVDIANKEPLILRKGYNIDIIEHLCNK